jgi:hypothetical protein
MIYKRMVCFSSVLLVFGFGMLSGNQDSQNEEIVVGTSVEEIQEKLKDPAFDRDRAMMEAAGLGDLPVVQLLLENGVQPYGIYDEKDRTVFHEAAASGSADVFETLLRAAETAGHLNDSVHAMDDQYRTPLYDAALEGNIDVVRLLLDRGAFIDAGGKDGLRALHLAVIRGNNDLVDFLLSGGAFVLARDAEGKRALDYARALHFNQIVRKLEKEIQRYWQKPVVREIRVCVENYLNAFRAGDITTSLQLSMERHKKILGNKLDPASFKYDIKEIEIHEKESRTTYNHTDRWEEIR